MRCRSVLRTSNGWGIDNDRCAFLKKPFPHPLRLRSGLLPLRASVESPANKAGNGSVQRRAEEYLLERGFEQRRVVEVIHRLPTLAELSVDKKIRPALGYLFSLGICLSTIQKMLVKFPELFNYDPNTKMRPVVEFLMREVHLDEDSVCKVLEKFPFVLGYGVKSHLAPHIAYLHSLGVTHEQLPRLVLQRPQVLGEGIESLISYLLAIGVKRWEVGRLLATYPVDYIIPVIREGRRVRDIDI